MQYLRLDLVLFISRRIGTPDFKRGKSKVRPGGKGLTNPKDRRSRKRVKGGELLSKGDVPC